MTGSPPFKVAVITTVYRPLSHCDVLVSRWLEPRPRDHEFGWSKARTQIVSMYVAQFPENDMARVVCAKHGITLFDTVRDALTLGGDRLAVDGVLFVGEHGDYPFNAVGQKMYPRKELFDQIAAVFRRAGRAVPMFYDKHLSWNFDWALEIDATIRELRIPILAGSSLPFAPLLPPIQLPANFEVEETVGVFHAGAESYGFHSMEAVQTVIENRRGGETGIRAVTAYNEAGIPRALAAGAWSNDLMDAAVALAGPPQPYPPNLPPSKDPLPRPTAFVLEHNDGTRVAHISFPDRVGDFCLALRIKGGRRIYAARVDLQGGDLFYAHFARLCRLIEDMFLSGVSPSPVERTVLTTGALAACMNALAREGQRIETPQLQISYGA